jgi:predicted RNA-binding Zn ribbon-like protein
MAATHREKHIFELVGGALCLDFVNTRSNYYSGDTAMNERFNEYADVLSWAQQVGIVSVEAEEALGKVADTEPERARFVFERATRLREVIHSTFLAVGQGRDPDTASFELLNSEIADAMSHSRIVRGDDDYGWGWEIAPQNLERILWPVAKSAADLLVSGKLARVHECAGDTCGWLFLDTSKNHSRRWCDMKDCGNVAKARNYYRKTKQLASSK